MSATCTHTYADAVDHPECAGCRRVTDQYLWHLADQMKRQRHRVIVDDPRPSLLVARELTRDERVAQDEGARPGMWAGQYRADLRALTQDETDVLIRAELFAAADPVEAAELDQVFGGQRHHMFVVPGGFRVLAGCQRGGIDSDPLVRLLAYRAWGDRDRRWFADLGVRKGDPVTEIDPTLYVRAWDGDPIVGTAMDDALPGCEVRVVHHGVLDERGTKYICRVGNRRRDAESFKRYMRTLGCEIDRASAAFDLAPPPCSRSRPRRIARRDWCDRRRERDDVRPGAGTDPELGEILAASFLLSSSYPYSRLRQ